MWHDNKIKMKYNLVEEVRSFAVQNELLYTVCDKDVAITALMNSTAPDSTGKYTNRAILPGRAPLYLFGPEENGISKYLVFATRDGKGLILINNSTNPKFNTIWTKEVIVLEFKLLLII